MLKPYLSPLRPHRDPCSPSATAEHMRPKATLQQLLLYTALLIIHLERSLSNPMNYVQAFCLTFQALESEVLYNLPSWGLCSQTVGPPWSQGPIPNSQCVSGISSLHESVLAIAWLLPHPFHQNAPFSRPWSSAPPCSRASAAHHFSDFLTPLQSVPKTLNIIVFYFKGCEIWGPKFCVPCLRPPCLGQRMLGPSLIHPDMIHVTQ